MKKVIGILMCIVLAAGLLAACTPDAPAPAPQPPVTQPTPDSPSPTPAPVEPSPVDTPRGPIKVGIINNPPAESGYREANVGDFVKVFSDANGYSASFFYDITNAAQLSAARQFITDGVEYLLISAAETDGWDSVLRDAKEAGIKVFLFDRMMNVSQDLFEAAVVSDMANQGDLAMSWLLGQGLPEIRVVHIQGAMGSDAQVGRTAAFDREVAAGKMIKVAQQTATWDEAEAKSIVESVIASGEPFNVVYAENDGMARGAVAALQDAGITHGVNGDVIIIGVDANRWALREVLSGNWNLNVQCSPFQANVIHGMIQTLEGGGTLSQKIVISEERYFEAGVITQADIDQFGLGD